MIERIDASGRWESADDGASWVLVEPSAEWEAARGGPDDPDPLAGALDAVNEASTLGELRTATATYLSLLNT